MKKKIFSILRIVISFGLLSLLFYIMRNEMQHICKTIADSNLKFIGIAVVLILGNIFMLAYRLKVIFVGENLNISLWRSIQLTYVGYYFNNFMPTAVGGDIVKAHYASLGNKEKAKSYASVLMDRILGLYTFSVVAAVALIIDNGKTQLETVKFIVFALLLMGAFGFVVITNSKVAAIIEKIFAKLKMFKLGEKLSSIYSIVQDYKNRRGVIIKSFLISVFAQALYFTAVYLFFLSLGVRVNLANIFLIMPVVIFISMIPSIGGLGVREGAIVAFFSPLAGRDVAFAVSILVLFGLLLTSIIGGIIYLKWGFEEK
jgi:glycosyltransferase 2 family protein